MNNSLLADLSNSYVSCERIFYPHRKGQALFTMEELSSFMSAACEPLKEQKNCAQTISVLLEAVLDERHETTSLFNITAELPIPANQPEQLFLALKQCLTKLYSINEQYTRCEIVLLDLVPEESINLFKDSPQLKLHKRNEKKEKINAFSGMSKNRLYSQAMRSWKSKSQYSSQKQVNWSDLEVVFAK